MKKDSKTSRAALKRFRDSLIADDDNPVQESTDLDAHEELFYGALSQLRTIREPGKKELTLEEAFEAALSQFEVFQKWCDSGKLLGEIRGCVEGKEVFRFNEGFDFHAISFGVPPTDDAVLQITTEVDGEEIVLYNLRLEDVPLDDIPHTEYWPNGQHISLTITRELGAAAASQGSTSRSSQANFHVKIAVNADLSEERVSNGVHDEIEDDDSTKDTNKHRARFPFFNLDKWLTPFPTTREWLAAAVALAIVPLCFLLLLDTFMPVNEIPAQQGEMAGGESQLNRAPIAENQNESPSPEAGKEVTKDPASTSSGFSASKSAIVLNHVRHQAPPMPRSEEEANAVAADDKISDQAVRNRIVRIKSSCSH